VSVIALIFSMTGGALAVQSYVITAPAKQISPHALAVLRKFIAQPASVVQGAPGATGATGAKGDTIVGPEGKQGATGLTGQQGPGGESVRGPRGEAGPSGAPGSAFEQVREYEATSAPLLPGEHRTEGIVARCPSGTREIGGGYEASEAQIHVYASAPAGDWGWDVSAINESTTNTGTVTVEVFCTE
jgi:hypothetical protein